jgi:hypothetical protein
MLRHLKARLTYANVAATLALFVALGAGIAYAADGDANSCNNVRPADIAAPIQSGTIGVPQEIIQGEGSVGSVSIKVDGDGRFAIRHAAITTDRDRVRATYTVTLGLHSGGAEEIRRTETIVIGGNRLSSVEFSVPVKQGTYEVEIGVEAFDAGGTRPPLQHKGDWTYQLLPEA